MDLNTGNTQKEDLEETSDIGDSSAQSIGVTDEVKKKETPGSRLPVPVKRNVPAFDNARGDKLPSGSRSPPLPEARASRTRIPPRPVPLHPQESSPSLRISASAAGSWTTEVLMPPTTSVRPVSSPMTLQPSRKDRGRGALLVDLRSGMDITHGKGLKRPAAISRPGPGSAGTSTTNDGAPSRFGIAPMIPRRSTMPAPFTYPRTGAGESLHSSTSEEEEPTIPASSMLDRPFPEKSESHLPTDMHQPQPKLADKQKPKKSMLVDFRGKLTPRVAPVPAAPKVEKPQIKPVEPELTVPLEEEIPKKPSSIIELKPVRSLSHLPIEERKSSIKIAEPEIGSSEEEISKKSSEEFPYDPFEIIADAGLPIHGQKDVQKFTNMIKRGIEIKAGTFNDQLRAYYSPTLRTHCLYNVSEHYKPLGRWEKSLKAIKVNRMRVKEEESEIRHTPEDIFGEQHYDKMREAALNDEHFEFIRGLSETQAISMPFTIMHDMLNELLPSMQVTQRYYTGSAATFYGTYSDKNHGLIDRVDEAYDSLKTQFELYNRLIPDIYASTAEQEHRRKKSFRPRVSKKTTSAATTAQSVYSMDNATEVVPESVIEEEVEELVKEVRESTAPAPGNITPATTEASNPSAPVQSPSTPQAPSTLTTEAETEKK